MSAVGTSTGGHAPAADVADGRSAVTTRTTVGVSTAGNGTRAPPTAAGSGARLHTGGTAVKETRVSARQSR